MFTKYVAQRKAERLVEGLKAAGRTQLGFLDLLDDKGYVPAEPKVETRLEKAAVAMVAAVISIGHMIREAYDWLAEPEFGFLDLLAAKGHVPAAAAIAAPERDGANDNWPATHIAA